MPLQFLLMSPQTRGFPWDWFHDHRVHVVAEHGDALAGVGVGQIVDVAVLDVADDALHPPRGRIVEVKQDLGDGVLEDVLAVGGVEERCRF